MKHRVGMLLSMLYWRSQFTNDVSPVSRARVGGVLEKQMIRQPAAKIEAKKVETTLLLHRYYTLYIDHDAIHSPHHNPSTPHPNDHPNLLKPLLRRLPIDNIPNSLEILRLAILVLQIIRMLPSINPQQRPKLPDDGILIRVRLDPNGPGLRILHQPRPAGALDTGERGVEFLLHAVEAAVGSGDGVAEFAARGLAAAGGGGREVFPEEGVVCCTACTSHCQASLRYKASGWIVCRDEGRGYLRTSVEVDQRLLSNLALDVALDLQLFHLLQRGVVRVDVGAVMLIVVKLHDLARDGWFEGAVVVYT